MNARVAGLFMLVLLEYNGKGVVHATSRGLDMAPHWLGVGAAPLMSPRQDETSEPLLYAGWMAGPYRVEDATRGRKDDLVTSDIKASTPKMKMECIGIWCDGVYWNMVCHVWSLKEEKGEDLLDIPKYHMVT
ncbi:hypothetical protein Tco_0427663 [Tanacetum coccineum]